LTPEQFWAIADRIGTAGAGMLLALIFVVTGKFVVPRWVYDEQVKLTQEWKELALRGTNVLENFSNRVRRKSPSRE
jgi:hypothetical protein